MTHDLYRELLQRELDDDLTADEQEMLDAHLSTCADCRLEREEYQSLSFGLSKLIRVMPETSFVPQLELEVKRTMQEQRRTARRVPAWWRSATAAAAVVLAVGLAGYWQFAGSSGTDGRVALDSSATETKDASLLKDLPVAGAPAQEEAGSQQKLEEPKEQTMLEPPKEQTALRIAPKSVPVPVPVPPQESSPAEVSQEKAEPVESEAEKASNLATPAETLENDSDSLGGLIGGAFGTEEENSSLSLPSDGTMGLSGDRTGMLGVEEEQVPLIGETPPLAHITENLQEAVREGDQTAKWATDPALVVEVSREQLGFRNDATIQVTTRADRVRIEQDGAKYEVRLEQPYDQGANGIWRPAQVGLVIDPGAPDSLQRPIVDYFRTSANQALQGDLLVIDEFDARSGTMRIAADLENETREYLCTLQLNAEGQWELVGAPIEQ